ncbi:hypothetical protein HGRIS_001486 [Hohenbuehelia grisea]|uniref:Uncharacterized protein n=1 Tax=Hohenbuehelia grisea TaxID=104357 RepID=A0ABR3JPM3_9AGAR
MFAIGTAPGQETVPAPLERTSTPHSRGGRNYYCGLELEGMLRKMRWLEPAMREAEDRVEQRHPATEVEMKEFGEPEKRMMKGFSLFARRAAANLKEVRGEQG